MEAASAVRNIPLDRLVLSPANARKTPPSAAEDAELKASIKAHCLKQNLVVCPASEGRGLYAVTAGGRRLKALQELATEGVIPAGYEVPCLVEEPNTALETSLMENTVRAAMHPADEFAAMAALIDTGEPIETVATRFGVSERHVRQRLRLGKVAAELQAIEDRLAALEALPEDAWSEGLVSEAEDLQARHGELIETAEAEAVYAEEDRARAGCIVTIGDDGDFRIYEGLVERSATPDHSENGGTKTAEGSDEAFGTIPCPRPLTGEAQLRKECGFSQALVDDLKAHRLQIAKVHIAGDFGVAFDLALYALCVDLRDRGWRSCPLDLRAVETRPSSSLNDLAGTPADRLLAAHEKALDLDWLSLPPAEGFAALAALPGEAKQDLFAWCIAATLKPQLAVEDGADPVVESAVRRLAIPFADFWRPTAANYWGRAKKAHGLAVAESVLGRRWAQDHAGDKKAALAAALETAFDPESNTAIGLDRAARDVAAAWLPPGIAADADAVQGDDGGAAPDAAFATADEPRAADFPEGDAASDDLPAFLTGND